MELKKKWDELDKQKKLIIGIGSAVAIAAVGAGVAVATTNGDEPAQTKVADNSTSSRTTDRTKDTDDNKDNETEQLDSKNNKSTDTDKKSEKDAKSTDKKSDGTKDEKKKDEETKETVTKKEDGTAVKVSRSISKTPTVTVKVQKNTTSSSNKTSTSSSASKSENNITTKTTTSTQSIPYQTVYQNDSSLEKGKQVVAQNGQNGVKTITYKETYVNGNLSSKDVISSTVTKNTINKIIKIGTKVNQPTTSYLSASQAKGVLSSAGVFSGSGSTYSLKLSEVTDLVVRVGGDHVSSISYNASNYLGWDMSLSQCIDLFGQDEGQNQYQYAQNGRNKVERAVRAAANAVYGSGTEKANYLYSQIINSRGFNKSF